MKNGVFISIEGGEACGKSTQVKKLKEYINACKNKDNFIYVREPGGTPLAEEIRKLLLNYEEDNPLPMTELLLFCAARCENTHKRIKPALNEGKVVIADRFYDSTIAYQGMARQIMSPEEILTLTKAVIGDVKPDLTLYLKLEPKEAFKRKANLSEELDRIEKEGLKFHQNVKKGYDYISSIEPERFCVIDASKSPEEVFEEIINAINQKFPNIFKN